MQANITEIVLIKAKNIHNQKKSYLSAMKPANGYTPVKLAFIREDTTAKPKPV